MTDVLIGLLAIVPALVGLSLGRNRQLALIKHETEILKGLPDELDQARKTMGKRVNESVRDYSIKRELPNPMTLGLLSTLAVLLTNGGLAIAKDDLNREWLKQSAPVLGITMIAIGFLILFHLAQTFVSVGKLRRKMITEQKASAKITLRKIELLERDLETIDLSEVSLGERLAIEESHMRLAEAKERDQIILNRDARFFPLKFWKKNTGDE